MEFPLDTPLILRVPARDTLTGRASQKIHQPGPSRIGGGHDAIPQAEFSVLPTSGTVRIVIEPS